MLQIDFSTVAHHGTLGSPCGSGGIDHVDLTIGINLDLRVMCWPRRQCGSIAIQAQYTGSQIPQCLQMTLLRDHQRRCSVLHHIGQTLFWVRGIQWDIGGTGFENTPNCHQQIRTPIKAYPYPNVFPDPVIQQVMSHTIGTQIQFCIG